MVFIFYFFDRKRAVKITTPSYIKLPSRNLIVNFYV